MYDSSMSNETSSAFAADLAATVAAKRNSYPNGKPVMELALAACGSDEETVRGLLMARKLSSTAFIGLLKRHGLEPVPGDSTVRQWILAQAEEAK